MTVSHCPCCTAEAQHIKQLPKVERESVDQNLSPMEVFKAKKPANRKKKR